MLKYLTMWIITNCGKLLKKCEYQTILPVSWETCMQFKKQQLESCMEKLIVSGLRKCCLMAPSLFNLYAEHIMRNAGVNEL